MDHIIVINKIINQAQAKEHWAYKMLILNFS